MQEVIKIEGGHTLEGEVTISSAKNATVALIPATVLAHGPVTIVGVPQIADVESLTKILNLLGVQVEARSSDHLIIDPTNIQNIDLVDDAVTKLRASYYFMGALLGRFGRVCMKMPGGCYLGPRPIDLHLKGFEALGAKVTYDKACYTIEAKELKGAKIFLDIASVGATINIMMAAVYAKGRTTIENAAKEPEIIDVATLLNKMGAHIRGAGTNVITIDGVDQLMGCFHEIIPDRIEAGTFMIAAAITRSDILIQNIVIEHLSAVVSKLEEIGVQIIEDGDNVRVNASEPLKPTDIKTLPHPGFPTDMQSQMMALLLTIEGTSIVTETIFENRFMHVREFNTMNADISLQDNHAVIHGGKELHGARVKATDLRAAAALILAGLVAEGETTVTELRHLDRGYVDFHKKLKALGADIERVTEAELEHV